MKKRMMVGLLLLLMLTCSACTGRRSVVYETISESVTESSKLASDSEETEPTDSKKEEDHPAETDSCKAEKAEQTQEKEKVESLYVDLCGEVKNPGVYELPVGNRIFHAIKAAGGFTDQAETRCVNQAEALYDGEKITIYSRKEAEEMGGWKQLTGITGNLASADNTGNSVGAGNGSAVGAPANGSAGTDDTGKINLNQADKNLLMTLSGVGEAKAEAIISYREKNGAFSAVEDVMQVTGIKEKLFEQIRDKITV